MTRPSNSESSRNKFKVFDFDGDDDRSENMHKRFSADLRYRKNNKNRRRDSPINKYNFLQTFASGTEIADQGFRDDPIDVDGEGCLCTCSVMYPKSMRLEDGAVKESDAYFASGSSTQTSSSSTHINVPIGAVSSEISNTEASTSSTSTFCLTDNEVLGKQLIELDCSGREIDDESMNVKISPDIVLCGDISFVASCLTFSCSSLKLEGSSLNGAKETFCFEWTIRDIILIESEWTASVETAMVNLHLKSKTFKGAQNGNKTSGVEQLTFAVYDPNWEKVQDAIKRLGVRYKDIWNTHFDTDMVKVEKDWLAQSSVFSPKDYLSGCEEPFEDVIYPRGDPDAITIHKGDIELLEPDTFINDTIIDFYIKYLANGIQTKEKQRFHFFNCFFFRKLADLDKDPSSAYEGKAAFQRVRKWTRKVNIFEKDYIFIPVNYSLHWSLIVICYPGAVPNFKDEESECASKVPCILHMDSIRGSHKGLKNLIQSYLCEEWKERHNATTEDASSNFLHLKFVPLELPQQENLFDCGLFLLHYVERFLEEAPIKFSPFNITKFSNFLTRNWFPPEEASLKRYVIKKLIYEIFQEQSRGTPPVDRIDRYPSPVPTTTSAHETGVIFLEKSSSTSTYHGMSSASNAEQFGICSSKTSLTGGIRESDLVSLELFEPRDCTRSYADTNYPLLDSPCQRRTMTPIEEVEESDEKVVESPLDKEDCELVAESETLGKHEISMRLTKCEEWISVSSRSQGSPTLSREGKDIGHPPPEINGFDNLAEPDKQESSSTSCNEFAGCVVPDSEEDDSEHESNKVEYIPSFICIESSMSPP